MRKLVDFNPEEKAAYDIAMSVREYGIKTNAPNNGYTGSFYTVCKVNKEGNMVDVIKFKKQAFTNLLQKECPEDIESKSEDKLLIAFTVGIIGGTPKWNVPNA